MIQKIKTNLWIITLAILALLIAFAVTYFIKGTGKIAYIETNVILEKYEGAKDARSEYQKKETLWKANSDTLMKQFEAELKSYEKERTKLSAKERELKEQLLRNKQNQISNYRDAIQKKAQDEQQKIMQPVLSEINDFIAAYSKKHGYNYVLGANGTGNLMYANKALNITEQVLEGLNKEYKK